MIKPKSSALQNFVMHFEQISLPSSKYEHKGGCCQFVTYIHLNDCMHNETPSVLHNNDSMPITFT